MLDKHKEMLFRIACKAIKDAVNNDYSPPKKVPQELEVKKGVFVTLTVKTDDHAELRGCIGNLLPLKPLAQAVYDNAISAAIRDPRFRPLTRQELDKIKDRLMIEISILSEPKKIIYKTINELLSQIKPYEYGIIISYKGFSATFLPQVWEQLPTKEEFLSHLCAKAMLSPDFWRSGKLDIEYYTNEVIIGPKKFEEC